MRLSGWQRLGIIASVIWAVAVFLTTLSNKTDKAAHIASGLRNICEDLNREKPKDQQADCWKEWHEHFATYGGDYRYQEAALVALVPIPIAWLFAWIVRSLYRWVRRGFQNHSPRQPAQRDERPRAR